MADDLENQRGAVRGLPYAVARPVADTLASAMVIIAVGWALSLQRRIGLDLYPQQFFAAILFCTVPLAYLTLPAPTWPKPRCRPLGRCRFGTDRNGRDRLCRRRIPASCSDDLLAPARDLDTR